MEHMAQNFVKLMQALEETQRTVQLLKSSQVKEKGVLEKGKPNFLPERTPSVGNTRNGSEEPDGGLRGRSRNEPIHLDGHDGYGESWCVGR